MNSDLQKLEAAIAAKDGSTDPDERSARRYEQALLGAKRLESMKQVFADHAAQLQHRVDRMDEALERASVRVTDEAEKLTPSAKARLVDVAAADIADRLSGGK